MDLTRHAARQRRGRALGAVLASVALGGAALAGAGLPAAAATLGQSTTVAAAATGSTQWLTGYWHNFDNGSGTIHLADVPTQYNLVEVAFADASASAPGGIEFNLATKDFGGTYSVEQFKADVKTLHAQGRKVVLSIGGQNGTINVTSATQAANFASTAYSVLQEYGFDGVDIDFENGIDATYTSQALHTLASKVGSSFVLTMAPQTIDYQATSMAYYKLTQNVKDILTVVNTQYYNSGSMLGADGKVYSQGSVDFVTSQAAILLDQLGLRPDQVGLGYPATSQAAGGGYQTTANVIAALDCLEKGTSCGSFKPSKAYGKLGGVMTWSVNWDKTSGYAFANAVGTRLATGGGSTSPTTPPTSPTTPPTSPTTPPTSPTTPPASCATTAWSSTTVYTGGQKVSYNGSVYQAKWWTLNEKPGASEWGPWALVGSC
ncbi:MAG TPA: glycosyl hydrolase family 18 protein [Luteimicrobium sp.]|nr:glycosyl hydrolase family 18 protein [Luteimicrobium sp.]